MRRVSPLLITGFVLLLAAPVAQAIGFGRTSASALLGQPLNFTAILRLDADEQFAEECISAEVFAGENKLPAGLVRVSVGPIASSTDRLVRVGTTNPVDEPVVTVNLTAGCNAKVSRRFVVFLDPPVVNLAQTAAEPAPAVASSTEAPRKDEAPLAAAASEAASGPVTTSSAPKPVVRPKPRPRPSVITAARPAPRPAAPVRTRPGTDDTVVAATPPTGPRLKLEAPVALPGARPSAPTVAGLPAAASAASQAVAEPKVDPQNELIEKERERLRAMEENLNRLRAETLATQKSLAALQSRLKGAESERLESPLVYGLLGLCGLLAVALFALWRRSTVREAAWWASPAAAGAAAAAAGAGGAPAGPAAAIAAAAALTHSARVKPAGAPAAVVKQVASEARNVAVVDDADYPSRLPDTMPPGLHDDRDSPSATGQRRRELSVEELIDLEQQAEFFIVLGQDDAAIDLLMGHLRNTGGSSPLPYLKLLEIYRRRGERETYERTRERFNRRFNAYAPEWESDPQQGLSLEDYPEVIVKLQSLWATPAQVIEYLDAALFRRDESADTFDVPAYRELVLLYSVVRDIAEHDGSAEVVDLLLPIDDSTPAPAPAAPVVTAFAALQPQMVDVSITEFSAESRKPPVLDLDISAVRAFDRPASPLPEPERDFAPGSSFLGLVDPIEPPEDSSRKR
jgi:pilus assembly protein FimV